MTNTTSRRRRLRQRLKELPVFPTIITSGNLACGVMAILFAVSKSDLLLEGAILIFAAMVLDMFDGKVARMTGTEGEFGAELDSLADLVSFGVAPAMLVYRMFINESLFEPGTDGQRLICFAAVFYVVLTAIRLARYNVEHDQEATNYFRGIPSPGSAAFLCAWIMFYAHFERGGVEAWQATIFHHLCQLESFLSFLRFSTLGGMVFMALLMVSTIRFAHIGNTLLGGRMSFPRLALLFALIGFVVVKPIYALAFSTGAYLLISLLQNGFRMIKHNDDAYIDEDEDDDDDHHDDHRTTEPLAFPEIKQS